MANKGFDFHVKFVIDDERKRQANGMFIPVYGPPSLSKEEEYIERMIARDIAIERYNENE